MVQRKLILLLVLFLLAPPRSFPEDDIEVKSLLERVSKTYRDLKSYRFEAILSTESDKGKRERGELQVSFAIAKPDKARVSVKGRQMDLLTISNGRTTWVYMEQLHQFIKKEVSPETLGTEKGTGAGPDLSSLINDFAGAYTNLVEQAENATLSHQEPLDIDGKPVQCYVMDLKASRAGSAASHGKSGRTLWIDKDRYVILKEISRSETGDRSGEDVDRSTRTTVFSRVEVNESLPDDLFVFQPSEEAQQVEQFDFRMVKAQSGPEAPDFTLKDLDGHSFHLKGQRGKAVLIQFWASWCGPCRIEMPFVEELHRRFRHKGLTVVGVNDEDPEVAQEFLQDKEFTFPMLVDAGGEVGNTYEVDAIPTLVLIDQEGKIVHRDVGLGNGRELRQALKRIGIDSHDAE